MSLCPRVDTSCSLALHLIILAAGLWTLLSDSLNESLQIKGSNYSNPENNQLNLTLFLFSCNRHESMVADKRESIASSGFHKKKLHFQKHFLSFKVYFC